MELSGLWLTKTRYIDSVNQINILFMIWLPSAIE